MNNLLTPCAYKPSAQILCFVSSNSEDKAGCTAPKGEAAKAANRKHKQDKLNLPTDTKLPQIKHQGGSFTDTNNTTTGKHIKDLKIVFKLTHALLFFTLGKSRINCQSEGHFTTLRTLKSETSSQVEETYAVNVSSNSIPAKHE